MAKSVDLKRLLKLYRRAERRNPGHAQQVRNLLGVGDTMPQGAKALKPWAVGKDVEVQKALQLLSVYESQNAVTLPKEVLETAEHWLGRLTHVGLQLQTSEGPVESILFDLLDTAEHLTAVDNIGSLSGQVPANTTISKYVLAHLLRQQHPETTAMQIHRIVGIDVDSFWRLIKLAASPIADKRRQVLWQGFVLGLSDDDADARWDVRSAIYDFFVKSACWTSLCGQLAVEARKTDQGVHARGKPWDWETQVTPELETFQEDLHELAFQVHRYQCL